MLVSFADVEHQAHCVKCRRDSPVLAGTPREAELALLGLGWNKSAEAEWRCPICARGASGTYRLTVR